MKKNQNGKKKKKREGGGEERMCLYWSCLTHWKFVLLQGFHTIWPSGRELRWLNGLKIFTKGCPCTSGILTIILNFKSSKPEYSKKSFPSPHYMLSDLFGVSFLSYPDLFRWLSSASLSLQNKTKHFPTSTRVILWICMCECVCASLGYHSKTQPWVFVCQWCLRAENWKFPPHSLKYKFWAEGIINSLVLLVAQSGAVQRHTACQWGSR